VADPGFQSPLQKDKPPYEVITLPDGRILFAISKDKSTPTKPLALKDLSALGEGLADFTSSILSGETLLNAAKSLVTSATKGCVVGAAVGISGLVTVGPGCLGFAAGAVAADGVLGIFRISGTVVGSFVEASKVEGVEREAWLRLGGQALGQAMLAAVPAIGAKLRLSMVKGAPAYEILAPGMKSSRELGRTLELTYRGMDLEQRHLWEYVPPKMPELFASLRLGQPMQLASSVIPSVIKLDLKSPISLTRQAQAVAGIPVNHPRYPTYPGLNDTNAQLTMNEVDRALGKSNDAGAKEMRSGVLRLLKLGTTKDLSESTRAIVLHVLDCYVLGNRDGIYYDIESANRATEPRARYFLPLTSLTSLDLLDLVKEKQTNGKGESPILNQQKEIVALKAVEGFLTGMRALAEKGPKQLDPILTAIGNYFAPKMAESKSQAQAFQRNFSQVLSRELEELPLAGSGLEALIIKINPKDCSPALRDLLKEMGISQNDPVIALKVSPTSRIEEGIIQVLVRRAAKAAVHDGSQGLADLRDYQAPFTYAANWGVSRAKEIEVPSDGKLIKQMKAVGIEGMDSAPSAEGKTKLQILPLRWVEAETLRNAVQTKLLEKGLVNPADPISALRGAGVRLNPNIIGRLEGLLDLIHSSGVSHNDLNLGNIFIKGSLAEIFDGTGKSDPIVILHDFGRSERHDSKKEAQDAEDVNTFRRIRELLPNP